MEEKSINNVKIDLKKSSSTGKVGYDISVMSDGTKTEKELTDIAEIAVKVALKAEAALVLAGK